MTSQASECVFFQGQRYRVDDLPLEQLPEDRKPTFSVESTGCWRGYVGHWLVDEEQLWLLALDARIGTEGGVKDAVLDELFPGCKSRVLADWYTGKIDLPEGEPLYNSTPYGPWIYERTRRLQVVQGRVSEVELIENPADMVDADRASQRSLRLLR